MRRFTTILLTLAAGFLLAWAPSAANAGASPKASKSAKSAQPTITRVTPMRLRVGATLTIRGKGFKAKPKSNTVIFQSGTGRTAFVKPQRASSKKLVLRVSASVARLLRVANSLQQPTRLKLRVLAGKFSKFTPRRLSPVVTSATDISGPGGKPGKPIKPIPVCNSDSDHDNDLLSNSLELQIHTDPCLKDTDEDGLEDGYEYQSALDLNDDEDQEPNAFLPYPGKRPYPNPLDPSDRNTDFDGDSMTLIEEQTLWSFAIASGRAARTRSPLFYSDGEQYSMFTRRSDGRRVPTLLSAGYERQANFLAWTASNGYRSVELSDGEPWWNHDVTRNSYGLLDFNRDGAEASTVLAGYAHSETLYFDYDTDGYLSDDERDEDADGLTNFDETHSRMTSAYWAACYQGERAFPNVYAGTYATDPDSDGDGVRDGADDQDHDDVPNVMELSRLAASGLWDAEPGYSCRGAEDLPSPPDTNHPTAYGRVNPYNPCLPARWSRTCTRHPSLGDNAPAPFDGSLNWASLN